MTQVASSLNVTAYERLAALPETLTGGIIDGELHTSRAQPEGMR